MARLSAPTNTQNMTSSGGPEVDILNPTNDSDDEDDRGNAPEQNLLLQSQNRFNCLETCYHIGFTALKLLTH